MMKPLHYWRKTKVIGDPNQKSNNVEKVSNDCGFIYNDKNPLVVDLYYL